MQVLMWTGVLARSPLNRRLHPIPSFGPRLRYDRLLLDWKAPGTKDAGTPEAESVSEVETVAEAAAA